MKFWELSGDQTRQYIDTKQVFETWRGTASQMWNGHAGEYTANLNWEKSKNGRVYLVQRKNNIKKSLGRKSPELERKYTQYKAVRDRLIDREKSLRAELKRMAPINKAMLLGRVPKVVANILRKFDEQGLLGQMVTVIGTNALYAYEAQCAVQLHSSVLATKDADFLWDSDAKLTLAIDRVRVPSVIGLLKRADPSFDAGTGYGYFAVNKTGFEVEILIPSEEETDAVPIGLSDDDLQATPYRGLQALMALPRMTAVAIDESGIPVHMVVPEIRAFALHKEWVAGRSDRKIERRSRDREQAKIIRQMAQKFLGLSFDDKDLSTVPKWLSDGS